MGFGHRVYRAYDPRAAALRKVAEGMEHKPDWLAARHRQSRTSPCALLAEKHPERPLKTNVEFYAAPVLMGVGPHRRTCSRRRSRSPATPAGPPTSSSRRPTTG